MEGGGGVQGTQRDTLELTAAEEVRWQEMFGRSDGPRPLKLTWRHGCF